MNVPNAISVFRLFLVPAFIIVYFSGQPNCHIYALLIFLLAGFTDFLDGYIARKYNLVTMLGRIIDPVADKLMLFTALICLAISGTLHFIFPILYFLKEVSQLWAAKLLMDKIADVPPANIWGKVSTCLFYLAVTMLIVFTTLPYIYPIIVLCVSFCTSLIAGVSYYFRSKRLVKQSSQENTNGGN